MILSRPVAEDYTVANIGNFFKVGMGTVLKHFLQILSFEFLLRIISSTELLCSHGGTYLLCRMHSGGESVKVFPLSLIMACLLCLGTVSKKTCGCLSQNLGM